MKLLTINYEKQFLYSLFALAWFHLTEITERAAKSAGQDQTSHKYLQPDLALTLSQT